MENTSLIFGRTLITQGNYFETKIVYFTLYVLKLKLVLSDIMYILCICLTTTRWLKSVFYVPIDIGQT